MSIYPERKPERLVIHIDQQIVWEVESVAQGETRSVENAIERLLVEALDARHKLYRATHHRKAKTNRSRNSAHKR